MELQKFDAKLRVSDHTPKCRKSERTTLRSPDFLTINLASVYRVFGTIEMDQNTQNTSGFGRKDCVKSRISAAAVLRTAPALVAADEFVARDS
jgi:hypothetical protein